MGIENRRRPLFDIGSLVATPAALEVMQDRGVYGPALIKRHVTGDYGDICDEDRAANEEALKSGARIMSVYTIDEVRLWVITDAVIDEEGHRQATTILLPEDY